MIEFVVILKQTAVRLFYSTILLLSIENAELCFQIISGDVTVAATE